MIIVMKQGATRQEIDYVANIITAKGMGKATEFSLALIEALKDKETADKISSSVFA